MSGTGNLYSQAIGQLPPNMQNYVGGASYTGMRQDQNQNPGGMGMPGSTGMPGSANMPQAQGMMAPQPDGSAPPAFPGQPMGGSPLVGPPPQSQGAPDLSSGGASWPGFGMGGLPGSYGGGFSQQGLSVMPPSGQSGQDFLNGFMPNGGAMPYGGGSGMNGGPFGR